MVYSFHHFYYWLKGGVETGQAYRAMLFRELGTEAKFVYATPFPNHVFQHEIHNLGLLDSEVIWMYGAFTDCKVSPATYTLAQFLETLGGLEYTVLRNGDAADVRIPSKGLRYHICFTGQSEDTIRCVLVLSRECLLRTDYYTYCRVYSEFFAPKDGYAKLYLRRFYNEDGSVAYEEMENGKEVMYKFPDRVLYSREEFLAYFMSRLHLTSEDTVLIDGEPGNIELAAFIENAYPARVGLFLHAQHSLEEGNGHILWYHIYEYAFAHPEKISFFMTNTDAQTNELKAQMKKYRNAEPVVLTIPTSGLNELIVPTEPRKRHALITAGRLAPEKNTAWTIMAVVEARKQIPDLTLDIYGEGAEYGKLSALIKQLDCGEYVHLCGFQKLSNLYKTYDAYVSASFVETLGITFLEAVGSGLPLVAFDIPYGAQYFIDEGQNGYKAKYGDVSGLAKGIVKMFREADIESFRRHSYEKASEYLREEIMGRWKNLLGSGTMYS